MKATARIESSITDVVLSRCLSPVPRAARKCAQQHAEVPSSDHVASLSNRRASRVSCPRSSQWLFSTFLPPSAGRSVAIRQDRTRGSQKYSTAAAVSSAPKTASQNDKKELRSFVQGGNSESVEEHLEYHRDPYRRGYAQPAEPKLLIATRKQDVQYPSREETLELNDERKQVLQRLCDSVRTRLRHPRQVSLEHIHQDYSLLPEPRMLYIPSTWRIRLMRVMGTPEKRDLTSMLRYFSLVADVRDAGLALLRSQWNYALAFATTYAAQATTQHMESTLRLWGEMERDANVPSNNVTFNILYNVAAKAGNFALADMIYKEMDNRGIQFNRFHRVSLIHYFGLKLDSDGIRSAYKEMVDSDDIIDTVALNCVISGFLRCGEEPAAEDTYRLMKKQHPLGKAPSQTDVMTNKAVSKALLMFTKLSRQNPAMKPMLQKKVLRVPDFHTFKLFVEHYAINIGDIGKVAQYLDDMKHLNIVIQPTLFLALFKGFFSHGGFAGSDWSQQRLDSVLKALYRAHDEQTSGFRIDMWVVIWALRAVKKCSATDPVSRTLDDLSSPGTGSESAVSRTFDELSRRWSISAERQGVLFDILDSIEKDKDMMSPLGKWQGGLGGSRRKKDGSRL